jgi:hypothetical protein
MKNKLLLLFSVILLTSLVNTANSQTDYSEFKSIVNPQPFFNPAPNGTKSLVVITNDFDNFNLGTDFGEPYIAVNPRDPLNSMCAFNFNGFYYTIDGYNWIRNSPAFSGYGILGDPVMTYDSIGNAIYVQLYQNGGTYGIVVMKSTNKGVSWIGPYNVWSTTAGLADKEWITADQTGGPYSNNVYIGWRQFGASGMRFTRSTNGGVSWSAPLTFGGQQGAYVCVGPNGAVQGGSVYFGALTSGAINVTRSTDGGATFSAQINACIVLGPGVPCAGRNTVKNCIRIDPFPRMAADNSYTSTRGNVYVVWADNPTGPDNADIFITRSTDFGATWSAPLRVNDDPTGIVVDQFMPTVSVDNITGKVYISWYDSRVDGANNILTRIYGSVSTNGGVSFTANANVSDVSFNPNNMVSPQPGGENYIGDYMGTAATKNTSYVVWGDGRNNSLGSFAGYYPDYAMNVSPPVRNIVNNDSTTFTIKIPAIKGPYSAAVKFTTSLDSTPTSGSITMTFANGRDSITSFPDSLTLKVKTIGSVNPRLFRITVKGSGPNSGPPVHIRSLNLLVNTVSMAIGTNHNGLAEYKVNGTLYNTAQSLVFPIGSVVSVQAISPHLIGTSARLLYVNWSDGGDTTHNITINNNSSLAANYKTQYKLIMNSVPGNTFGGNIFYDSAQSFTFGVISRNVIFNNQLYTFKGWLGSANGSYTSPDSSGIDTAITVSMHNAIVETARWVSGPIGISNIGIEIPKEYKLYQNYPNPFNPTTIINFDIKKDGNIRIVIYDLLGREVTVLLSGALQAGKYRIDFNAENYASGMYFYKITAGDFTDVKKMLILK